MDLPQLSEALRAAEVDDGSSPPLAPMVYNYPIVRLPPVDDGGLIYGCTRWERLMYAEYGSLHLICACLCTFMWV
jgi:hypothetical protein